jgi:glycosyltransferase involved in cell wall biosynthesis
MNIAMIGPFGLKPKGTLSVRALPMAQALVAHGHSVTLLIPPWDHPADAGREWGEGGVRVVNVPLPPSLPLLFHGWLALRLVRRALALNPDVIHCFKPKAYAGLAHLAFWWLRRTGLVGKKLSPRVRLVVDEDDWEQAWNVVEPYSPVQKWVFARQENWGLTHADAVVVASRALASLVGGAGVPPARIHYVPNGVRPLLVDKEGHQSSSTHRKAYPSMAQDVRTQWGLDDALVVLLYTRFFEFRLERVIEILRRVVEQVPQARLLIVGQGLFGEEMELDQTLKAAGLSDWVTFTGWVEARQLPGYFAASDAAIFPYDDTLINRTKCSVKLVDLLAAGLPVVADRVGQNAEYIVDGVSGLLVAPEDDAAFAEAVVSLLSDGDHRAWLGAAAAGRVREHFAWGRLVEEVERAYRWTT